MKSKRISKKIAIGSTAIFVISLAIFKLDFLGMLPALAMVLSFFMALIHGWLYLSGNNDKGDIFDVVHEANRTKSKSLVSGMNIKDKPNQS